MDAFKTAVVLGLAYCAASFSLDRLIREDAERGLLCWFCRSAEGNCTVMESQIHGMVRCNPGEDCYVKMNDRGPDENGIRDMRVERGCDREVPGVIYLEEGVSSSMKVSCKTNGCNNFRFERLYHQNGTIRRVSFG